MSPKAVHRYDVSIELCFPGSNLGRLIPSIFTRFVAMPRIYSRFDFCFILSGNLYTYECPDGLAFNSLIGVCDFPNNVKGCKAIDGIGKLYFVAYYLLSRESDQGLYELADEFPATCLPYQSRGIPLSAFPNGTTSKLAGLFSTLSL